MKFTISTPEQMEQFGHELAKLLRAGDLVLLEGNLGAGKTTLTRGIGEALGASGTIQSPTFVLARTHKTTLGPKLVHVDAYRLSSAVELDDLDIDFERSIVVIEWPRDFLDGVLDQFIRVKIDRGRDDDVREVELSAKGDRWQGVQIAFSA
jgi:tRNA threonylcarbamoyl adenosine modification protein YjeE